MRGGFATWKGTSVSRWPDRNFEISFDYATRQSNVGLFEVIARGGRDYDRELGLRYGRPYIRLWKGQQW